MRRRIYWLLPDLPSARRTTRDLLLAHIPETRIRFVAPENADLLRSARIGMMVGAPPLRVGEIGSLLHNQHTEAHFEGVEPKVPAFP